MRHGIISSCQSAATSEIVKRCCSSLVSSAIISTRSQTFTFFTFCTECRYRQQRYDDPWTMNSTQLNTRRLLLVTNCLTAAKLPWLRPLRLAFSTQTMVMTYDCSRHGRCLTTIHYPRHHLT